MSGDWSRTRIRFEFGGREAENGGLVEDQNSSSVDGTEKGDWSKTRFEHRKVH